MRKYLVIWISLWHGTAICQDNFDTWYLHLSSLDFNEAKQVAEQDGNTSLRFEMLQLSDILYYEGQIDSTSFKISEGADDDLPLSVLRKLNRGYLSLFYAPTKGNAYKDFYDAYQISKSTGNASLIKLSLMALLKYHNFEIAQNSDSYLPYLQHFEALQSDPIDRFWITIYKLIFYSKSLQQLENDYFKMSVILDEYEHTLDPGNVLLTYVFYERALQLDIEKKSVEAIVYYKKTVHMAADYPFLRYHRFFASLKLMLIESDKKSFDSAGHYLNIAKTAADRSDTLRSDYYLNMYTAFFMRAQDKNDSAFNLLWDAYRQDFRLDFRRNTLEINRLNVELETREKENMNLRLRQSRSLLIAAIAFLGLLFATSYFVYASRLSKNKAKLKEKEIESIRLEKKLKDQEISGLDAMIEGQEKERQRIAADLHDHLGSVLTTLKFHFEALQTKGKHMEPGHEILVQKTDSLLEEAYQKVRTMAHARNAGVNAKDGLMPAIRQFASKVSVLDKLKIDVEEHDMNERLDNSMEILIFRITQELITNVVKHAHATEVTIHLTKYEEAINLMVEDNGIGFDISLVKPADGMGLYSIEKRIENMGGKITIDSILTKGTTVIIDIPLTV
jgi:signal transduction histidine kinase